MDGRINIPKIEITPMPQRNEVRNPKEDWTGKSNTALRRKLQNRLNKRASRKRKIQTLTNLPTTETEEKEPPYQIGVYRLSDVSALNEAISLFQSTGGSACMNPHHRDAIALSHDFCAYMQTPIPVDHQLLTLLHFNLVRALYTNITLLGFNIQHMSLDLNSPFAPPCGLPSANPNLVPDKLPSTLRPTTLQLTVPHHPEIDVFPFPAYRDNRILAGGSFDDDELCMDVLYGVGVGVYEGRSNNRTCKKGPYIGSGRTGLIVWADPWLQESWEVDEEFARKWSWLFRGCDELIRSTNYWRASRGEEMLVLEW